MSWIFCKGYKSFPTVFLARLMSLSFVTSCGTDFLIFAIVAKSSSIINVDMRVFSVVPESNMSTAKSLFHCLWTTTASGNKVRSRCLPWCGEILGIAFYLSKFDIDFHLIFLHIKGGNAITQVNNLDYKQTGYCLKNERALNHTLTKIGFS